MRPTRERPDKMAFGNLCWCPKPEYNYGVCKKCGGKCEKKQEPYSPEENRRRLCES